MPIVAHGLSAMRWLVSAWLAWTVVLSTDLVLHAPGQLSPALLAYALELSGLLALLASAPLALGHVVRLALSSRGVSGALWSTALVSVALVYPAWDQAQFLTAGDGIGDSPWLWPVRAGLFALVLTAGTALWGAHLLLVTDASPFKHRIPRFAAGALALCAVAGLVYLLGHELRAYTYFARTLALVAWVLAASALFALLRRTRWWLATALLVATGAALGTARVTQPDAFTQARNQMMRDSQLAVLTDMAVHDRDTSAASLDVSLPQRFDCAPLGPPRPPTPLSLRPEQRRNVILISFDALRADAVGMKALPARSLTTTNGHSEAERAAAPRLVMPNLTRFSSQSRYYERAVTTYPATLMAVGGALTGLSASDILFAPERPQNVFRYTRQRFDRQFISLPKSPWFDLPIIDALFIQGTATKKYYGARTQTSWLLQSLRKARREHKRVFAWIHYFEPHAPYHKHPGHLFEGGVRGDYASELSLVDGEFGRLISYLERAKWFEDSLVIVFSDHGEALGERDYRGHHVYLNGWITDIPLMVRAPGLAPTRTNAMADVTDIAPTVLHFANVPYGPDLMAGRSLLDDALERDARRLSFAEAFPARGRELFDITNRPITSWEALEERLELAHRGARNYLPKVAVVSADRRLIVNRVTGVTELYDRERDRAELHDLSAREPQTVRRLLGALGSWSRAQSERIYCAVERAQARTPTAAAAAPWPDGAAPTHTPDDAGTTAPAPPPRKPVMSTRSAPKPTAPAPGQAAPAR